MKKLKITTFLSMLLIVWITPSYAQMEDKTPVGNLVYETYKEKGVDEAMEMYRKLKTEGAEEYAFEESQLNFVGYKIMNEDNDPQAAKKIFWLNMQEYPNAVNPNDSYADVLVALGEKEEAKKYYNKAIETFEKKPHSEQDVARNARGKLAALENKHQDLSFLEGKWESNTTHWNEQNEEMKSTDEVSFTSFNDIVLVMEMKPESLTEREIPGYVWVVTYNAQKDAYETAWAGPALRGLSDNSELKIESDEGNTYVLMEEWETDGDEYVARHEIQPQGDQMQWVIYQSKNGGDLRKVLEQDMTRQEMDVASK